METLPVEELTPEQQPEEVVVPVDTNEELPVEISAEPEVIVETAPEEEELVTEMTPVEEDKTEPVAEPVAANDPEPLPATADEGSSTFFLMTVLAACLAFAYALNKSSSTEVPAYKQEEKQREMSSMGGRSDQMFASWHKDPNIANRQRSSRLLNIDDDEIRV